MTRLARHPMTAFQAADGSGGEVYHCEVCGRIVLVEPGDYGPIRRVLVAGDRSAAHLDGRSDGDGGGGAGVDGQLGYWPGLGTA